MNLNLKGKIAVVTGAAQGIGKALRASFDGSDPTDCQLLTHYFEELKT